MDRLPPPFRRLIENRDYSGVTGQILLPCPGTAAQRNQHRIAEPRSHQIRCYNHAALPFYLQKGLALERIARGREKLRKILLESGNFSGWLPSNPSEKEG